MITTLYYPSKKPLIVTTNDLPLPNAQGYVQITEHVANLLGCPLKLVDVLASGENYIAYSIFNNNDEVNKNAMFALSAITGIDFPFDQEENILRGNILIQIENNRHKLVLGSQ